jgi:phosphoribosylformimino-5-aminoimidazole carboxamide ribotide isomerase
MPFTIFPAIDLRGGQVVRLKKGDPNRQTIYDSDPAQAAACWISHGARWLHVVNLDGAFGETDQANQIAIRGILKTAAAAGVRVQLGGGLRSLETVEIVLGLGVDRAILGTRAIEDPSSVAEALKRWGPERVAVSLDALDGLVRVAGWAEGTQVEAVRAAQDFKTMGLRWLVFTDIARDGLGTGLNLAKTSALAQATGLDVIASGGVHAIEDIEAVRAANLAGVIVGRALYEGQIDPARLFQLEG